MAYIEQEDGSWLTEKQIKFCNEYLVDLNGLQAAIRAGYSENTAGEIAYENLNKPHIKAFIAKRRAEIAKVNDLSPEWVVNRFKDISDRCMTAVPVMEFDPVEKMMKQKTAVTEEGEEIGVWEFDSTGANKATEMIGKHLGMFISQKVDVNAKVEQTQIVFKKAE